MERPWSPEIVRITTRDEAADTVKHVIRDQVGKINQGNKNAYLTSAISTISTDTETRVRLRLQHAKQKNKKTPENNPTKLIYAEVEQYIAEELNQRSIDRKKIDIDIQFGVGSDNKNYLDIILTDAVDKLE